MQETQLHRNPFVLLGVTTRDDRQRIIESSEERSLSADPGECQKARSDLTGPRTRLACELAWLPGVSPRKAIHLLEVLRREPMSIRTEPGLPALAQLNLMAAAFEAITGNEGGDEISEFIKEMAYLFADLSVEQILRDINEDRSVAGFQEVRGEDQVVSELSERKRHYRSSIRAALDKLKPAILVGAMVSAVDGATRGGEKQAPELIDDLVDSYEVETQEFLQEEAKNAHQLIETARSSAATGEVAVEPIVDKLMDVARNWDRVAQPIQLSAKARGLDHAPSLEIAYAIRRLAVDLFNEHDMLAQAQKLTGIVRELFSELPDVSEQVEQDEEALSDILRDREESERKRNKWAREISFHTEVGLVFKDQLRLSPGGLTWKDQHYPLETVTCLRWGGVRNSVNGIPTGSTYTVAFGDSRSEAVVQLNQTTYTAFVDKLWRAVGIRLLTEMLADLRSGHEAYFGDAAIRDDGITLIKRRLLGSNEEIRCTWGQVHIWNADGAFYIGSKVEKKAYVELSYLNYPNTHVLERAVRMAFKKPGTGRLSDVLD
jgi:hypothetical protein